METRNRHVLCATVLYVCRVKVSEIDEIKILTNTTSRRIKYCLAVAPAVAAVVAVAVVAVVVILLLRYLYIFLLGKKKKERNQKREARQALRIDLFS